MGEKNFKTSFKQFCYILVIVTSSWIKTQTGRSTVSEFKLDEFSAYFCGTVDGKSDFSF